MKPDRPASSHPETNQKECEMTRFVGLDVHKRQITVAAVNAQQEEVGTVLTTERRIGVRPIYDC